MAETKEQEQSINEENPQDKSVAFFAGRANPPTPGHIKIMIQMLEFARNNDMIPRIYLSSSFNKDKKVRKPEKYDPIILHTLGVGTT